MHYLSFPVPPAKPIAKEYDWEELFLPGAVEQARSLYAKARFSNIASSDSSITGRVTLSRITNTPQIFRLPTTMSELKNYSVQFDCNCAYSNPRYYMAHGCVHCALLMLYRIREKGTPKVMESRQDAERRTILEAAKAEQERREKLRSENLTTVPATRIFHDLTADGPIMYDPEAAIQNITVTHYALLRLQQLLKIPKLDSYIYVTRSRTQNGGRTITASLDFDDSLESGTVCLSLTDDKFTSSYCTVPSCVKAQQSDYRTLCEHRLLLLERLWRESSVAVTQEQTDDNARTFFSALSKQASAELAPALNPQPAPQRPRVISLKPRITVEKGVAQLLFTGSHDGSKNLIVKKIPDLVYAYVKKRSFELTKKSSLDFSAYDLTEESVPVMEYLQRRLNDIQAVNDRLSRNAWNPTTLNLQHQEVLEGSTLDHFYSAFEGTSCEYINKSNSTSNGELHIGHSPIKLKLKSLPLTDARKRFLGVRVTGDIPVMIHGSSGPYLLDEHALSKVSEEEKQLLSPFLSVADSSGHIYFEIGLNHLQEYYYRVLPSLLDNPCVEITDLASETAHDFLPPEPLFAFYLDMSEDDRLLFKATVTYGTETLALGSPRLPGAYRDELQEKRVSDVIFQLLRVRCGEDGTCSASMDDERMFLFLQEGVPLLSRFGEIHGTSAFNKFRVRSVPTFSVGVSVSSSILDLSISSTDVSDEELLELLSSYQQKKRFYRMHSGDFIVLDQTESLAEMERLLSAMDLQPLDVIRRHAHVPVYRALYLDKLLEEHDQLVSVRDRTYRQIIKNFRTIQDSDFEPPASLENVLRPYQLYGFKWLRTLEESGFGGILADEMGLGKTLQMISIFQGARDRGVERPSLVVCPASLVFNWQEELHRFAPELSVCALAGNQRERNAQLQALARKQGWNPEAADEEAPLPALDGAVSDAPAALPSGTEAVPAIPAPRKRGRPRKNPLPAPAQELPATVPQSAAPAAPSKPASSKVKVIEGPLPEPSDVYIISYDLLKRDIAQFGDITFHAVVLDEAQYIKNQKAISTKSVKALRCDHRFALTGTPMENRLSELWSIFDFLMPGFLYSSPEFISRFEAPIAKSHDEEKTAQLRKMVGPFILRRRKVDVLKDLPAKMEEVRYSQMDQEQQRLYDAQVVHMRQTLSVSTGRPGEDKIRILAELTKLRQICCDPSLLFENYHGASAKREACMDLINSAIDGGHRMLIFSQFTSMLALLEEDLNAAGIPFFKITGSTPKDRRLALVHAFNDGDTPVFLISLKAGGTGLNLTGADMVIHYDPWWNLAAQNQATDRAHRIGQTRQVTVFRLITKGTIEERILELQEAKKDLADAILEGSSESLMSMSNEELLALLS